MSDTTAAASSSCAGAGSAEAGVQSPLPSFGPRSKAALHAEVHRLRQELAAAVAQQQVNALYSLIRKEAISLVTGQEDDTQGLLPKRGGRGASDAAVSASGPPQPAAPRYCIGYAGVRQASFQRLLEFLMGAPAVSPALRLTRDGSFLDIGSGVGQCVLHARLVSKARCVGIEVVAARHQAACSLLQHVRMHAADFPDLQQLEDASHCVSAQDVGFVEGDIVQPQHHHLLAAASHVYMFDRVFMEDTHVLLLPLLCRRSAGPRILITCLSQRHLQRLWRCASSPIAAQHFIWLGEVQLDTDGDQSFAVHVYQVVPCAAPAISRGRPRAVKRKADAPLARLLAAADIATGL